MSYPDLSSSALAHIIQPWSTRLAMISSL